MTASSRFSVRIGSACRHGDRLTEFELVAPDGSLLPEFTAGSHIDVFLPSGIVRQYSLSNPQSERHRYRIVVQLEENGRGGSREVTECLRQGDPLEISQPRNNFPLDESAGRHLLIAGGIGITPIMSMLYALEAKHANFDLHYCTRSLERTAFRQELKPYVDRGVARIYHDGGVPQRGIPLDAILGACTSDTHVYFCGPQGMMQAIHRLVSAWSPGRVHHESFAPPTATGPDSAIDEFSIQVASTGKVFRVPADKSVVKVLEENGISVPTSCEAGVCGTCRVGVVSGIPDHRDFILDDDERENQMCACCSRAKSPLLVLAL